MSDFACRRRAVSHRSGEMLVYEMSIDICRVASLEFDRLLLEARDQSDSVENSSSWLIRAIARCCVTGDGRLIAQVCLKSESTIIVEQ